MVNGLCRESEIDSLCNTCPHTFGTSGWSKFRFKVISRLNEVRGQPFLDLQHGPPPCCFWTHTGLICGDTMITLWKKVFIVSLSKKGVYFPTCTDGYSGCEEVRWCRSGSTPVGSDSTLSRLDFKLCDKAQRQCEIRPGLRDLLFLPFPLTFQWVTADGRPSLRPPLLDVSTYWEGEDLHHTNISKGCLYVTAGLFPL